MHTTWMVGYSTLHSTLFFCFYFLLSTFYFLTLFIPYRQTSNIENANHGTRESRVWAKLVPVAQLCGCILRLPTN